MTQAFTINGKLIGKGAPTYVVAEISANHNRDFAKATRLVYTAKEAGADAVKVQTYTADTITLDSDGPLFRIKGSLWDGTTLHKLYTEAAMPWEWQTGLKALADDLGLDFFSSPFDPSAVDFLEEIDVPAYKVASCELVDIPLIRKIARTGKPIILSTGMALLGEIEEALGAVSETSGSAAALLKCTTAYPAPVREANLVTIPHMSSTFGVPVGLSDHTMGNVVPIAAVSLGACIVEKHFTLTRSAPGPDSSFSMEPDEFKRMVADIRAAETALGTVSYRPTDKEVDNRRYRRSLFAVRNIRAGEAFGADNTRSIRPGHGLHTRHLEEILGRKARVDIQRGTPLSWGLID